MFDFVHTHIRLHFKTLLEFHACDWLSEPQHSHTRTVFLHSKHLFVAGKATVSGHLTLTPLVAAHENNSCEQLAPVSDTLFASRGCPLTRTSTVLKINYERFKPSNEVRFLILVSHWCCSVTWLASGNWTKWSDWNECSRTCGSGIQFRKRVCIHPKGDLFCLGEKVQSRLCNGQHCPGNDVVTLV